MTTIEINGSLNVDQPSTFSSALRCLNHCQPFPVFHVYVEFLGFFREFFCAVLHKSYPMITGSLNTRSEPPIKLLSVSEVYICP